MIDLDDAKRHLNITIDDDDQLIEEKIEAAREFLCIFTGSDPLDTFSDISTPAPIKEACRQIVAHLYANREATLIGVTAQMLPFGVLDLLGPYRAYAF